MWKKGVWFFSFSFFTSFIFSESNGSLMHLELFPVENSCGSSCETVQPTQHKSCPSPTSYTELLLPFLSQTACLIWLTVRRSLKGFGALFLAFFTRKRNHNLTEITEWLRLTGSSGGELVKPLLRQGHPEQVISPRAGEISREETSQPLWATHARA